MSLLQTQPIPTGRASAGPEPSMEGRTAPAASLKSALDRAMALLLVVPVLPLIALAMLAVKLTSRGPAIYSQERVGLRGRIFRIYKIRTMTHNCEAQSGPKWSTKGDARVTPVGRVLRRTHLDELPQIWNVLRGEMSLVGPRPERPVFVTQLALAFEDYHDRHLVKPGVTGLAQVQLPPDTCLTSVRDKLTYDLYYVENLRGWLDLRILAATGLKVAGFPFAWTRVLMALPSVDEVRGGRDHRATSGTLSDYRGEIRLA